MATTRRSEKLPYVWVTWITEILAGEASCLYAPWFKARFKFDKYERGGGDLAQWKANHASMVETTVAELRAQGHTVTVEDQNSFQLQGELAILAGKPDIFDDTTTLVIDAKSGKRKQKDWWQVALYLVALPLQWREKLAGRTIRGEVRYPDGVVPVTLDQITPASKARIVDLMKRIGTDLAPTPEPSWRECRFCDLGPADCKARMRTERPAATKVDGLF